MDDVARVAGVSKMTVSRALNEPERVSHATRARVQSAVERLGYVLPGLARRTPVRHSGMIAVIVTDITNSFFTWVARGVEDVARRSGYTVVLCNSDEKVEKEREYVETLVTQRLDGAVVVPAGHGSRDSLELLAEHGIPFVLCDRRVQGVRADIVLGDSVGGARKLTDHLIGLGRRRIALVGGEPTVSTAQDRRAGYEQALSAASIDVRPGLVTELGYHMDDGIAAIDLLGERGVEFDAVVAANNVLGIGAAVRLRQLGRRVPEDVALASYDDAGVLIDLEPFFTVMAQPALNFGTLSAQMLVERMQGRVADRAREVVLVPELIVRRSSTMPSRSRAHLRA